MVDQQILLATDDYHQRCLDLVYAISSKIGLNYKDTKAFLNTRRVAREERTNYYMRKNRIYYENKGKKTKDSPCSCQGAIARMSGDILEKLEEINENIEAIRENSTEISVLKEVSQKLTGVGMFLIKITKFEEKKWHKMYGGWENECD